MKIFALFNIVVLSWLWNPFIQILLFSSIHYNAVEALEQTTDVGRSAETNQEALNHSDKYQSPDHASLRRRRIESNIKISVGVRKIIKFKNLQGKHAAVNLAQTVLHQFDVDNYVVIVIDKDDIASLEANVNIESIEDDVYWEEKGILDRVIDPEDIEAFFGSPGSNSSDANSSSSHFHRTLQGEQIPYGILMVQAPLVPVGPYTAKVCVVDTGIAIGHPDFNQKKIGGAGRKSMVDSKWLVWNKDARGHGTHIAGTIAARASNNYGVRGMGDIPLYITRGLSDNGQAYESDIRQAMQQCVDGGAIVLSLSLSGSSMSSSMKSLIDRFYASNIMIVAAAGNDGKRIDRYPASYSKVVSVGAVDKSETHWAGSNHGPWLELSAPGTGIPSTGFTYKGQYTVTVYTGTSMATPHVAGAAALLWSHYPRCTVTQIRYALAYTAKDKGTKGCDEKYGYGIVQVKKAYDFLRQYPCTNAVWGRNPGDGTCSAIDTKPRTVIYVPLSYNNKKANNGN